MNEISNIKKRDGSTVPFDPQKIFSAVKKAFSGENVSISSADLHKITDTAVEELKKRTEKNEPVSVENVQDVVEQTLMEGGYFKVAKAYILYRYEHKKEREKEVAEKIEEETLTVTKRNGKREIFSIDKLRNTLFFHVKGYENVIDVDRVVGQCRSEVYDGIQTKDVTRAIVMALRSMIEIDPAYSKIAARVLSSIILKEVAGTDVFDRGNIDREYREVFVKNIHRGVEMGRLDRRLLEFDLRAISQELVIGRDDLFEYLGLQTLYDRYFVRDDDTRQVLETAQMFWMRVAMGTALLEKPEERLRWTKEFYEIMSLLHYTPSTPTLFHAGTQQPQLSSCYLNTVPDSLDAIFKSYADNAQLSKWSGGLGTDWTPLRATGAFIKGTGVESQGVIPFLKIANDVTVAINRSGRRRGAAAVYLEVWHYDIFDFIELRKNTGDERRRTHDMDTATWIPDLFMKRVREKKDWTLFSPDETPELHNIYGRAFEEKYAEYERKADRGEMKVWKRIPAEDLWKKMLAMLFETGHPWMTWKDPSNVRSPQDHVGVVHNSNLCTEITLNTSENETAVCNLGSLNFAKFVVNGVFDKNLVGSVVMTAMRMLDNVIDINFYPTEDAKRSNMQHRPVGLGIRGFQDALYLLGINFDSEKCIQFADESMEVVSYYAILASSGLARERGAYKTFKGSKWDRNIFPQDTLDLLEKERGEVIPVPRTGRLDWAPVREHVRMYGMRNSNCLAVAPTATTANIVGCVPTIEPIYKNIYVKSNQAGDFVVVNSYLVEELKMRRLWNENMLAKLKYHDGSIQEIEEIPKDIKEKYKEIFEIDPSWLIRSAASRGKWIDQSQSLNIYFRGTSGKELSQVYFLAWEMGLKTTYYLRTLGASQVEKSTVDTGKFGSTHQRKTFSSNAIPSSSTEMVERVMNVESVEVKPEPVKTTEGHPSPFPKEAVSVSYPVSVGAAAQPKYNLIRIGDDTDCEACQA
ncbi:MAG TPA: ribonucleoside-diphosphate reductase subunit alpha [Candidatus Paceibacterota bacterium]|nr:ribonucleoside-diphosphate reductase subunit alpha [Candidatus Paceibacterota bacterium]